GNLPCSSRTPPPAYGYLVRPPGGRGRTGTRIVAERHGRRHGPATVRESSCVLSRPPPCRRPAAVSTPTADGRPGPAARSRWRGGAERVRDGQAGRPREVHPSPAGHRRPLSHRSDRAAGPCDRGHRDGGRAGERGSRPQRRCLGGADRTGQALPVQRTALLTGAQRERELEAAEDPDPELASPPPPSDAPRELVALLAVLVELRDVGTMAARQISGSLARPVAAMAAHAHWSALRLQAAAGEGEVPAAASIEEIVPTREVPETDPPSIGAESDHHLAVETAQQQEWYAGYVHEVLAARTEDEAERSAHLESSTRHRTR